MPKNILSALICLTILAFLVIGCSSNNTNPVSGNPVAPEVSEVLQTADLPSVGVNDTDGHELLGSWTMKFDPETLTAAFESDRETLRHYNVTSVLPFPKYLINSYDPGTGEVDVDVTVRNPYAISGYDVRLIIYTDSAGHTLNNEDNWTALYDISGGLPINPFKSYAKDEPNRLFAAGSSHTENLRIKMPGNNFNVKIAIDASYPGNCEEPYMMTELVMEQELYDRPDATAGVHVTVSRYDDWYRGHVYIKCPEVIGATDYDMTSADYKYFYGVITNSMNAPAGEYTAILIATINSVPIQLYGVDKIVVTQKPYIGWARQFVNDTNSTGVENDESGNVYFTLNPTNRVVKFTSAPASVWQHDMDTEGPFEQLHDLAYDPTLDYLYTTGFYYYCGTTNFSGLSIARLNKTTGNTSSVYQCFTAPVGPWDVCNDSAGNTYNIGVYGGDSPVVNTVMWKINTSMDTSWTNIFTNYEGHMELKDICSSSFDTIYAAGHYQGTIVDLDPSDAEYNYIPAGYQDAYLSEWNQSGTYVKMRHWGGYNDTGAVVYGDLVGEDNGDNIIVVGHFFGSVDFNPTGTVTLKTSQARLYDMYITKFTSSMLFSNCIQISSTENIYPTGIDFDSSNNIYVSGGFDQTVDFDPGTGTEERTSSGQNDMFIAKYDSSLNLVWVRTFGSTSYDSASDISFDTFNNVVYACGYFANTIDFNPGEGIYELTTDGSSNAFLLKLTPDGLWE